MSDLLNNEDKKEINIEEENKKEELSESETENVELEAMGDNKIIFLSKEEILKMKEKEKEKEE